eukprot:scaffold9371_cov211-Amphora_coffeaeformis.AAC.3
MSLTLASTHKKNHPPLVYTRLCSKLLPRRSIIQHRRTNPSTMNLESLSATQQKAIVALDLLAVACATVASLGCHLFRVRYTVAPTEVSYYEEYDIPIPLPREESISIGLMRREDRRMVHSGDPPSIQNEGGCSTWNPERPDWDAAWKFARAMAILSMIGGYFLVMFVACSRDKVRPLGGLHFVLATFSALMLVSTSSNMVDNDGQVQVGLYQEFPIESTEVGPNFYFPIVASILWIMAGCLVLRVRLCRPAPVPSGSAGPRTDVDPERARGKPREAEDSVP